MVCFSDRTLKFPATERELGRLLFFLISHFCFFRRNAVRTSVLRRTCIMKMKNPCKEKCASFKQSENITLSKANKVVRSCFFIHLATLFLQFPTITNIHTFEHFLRRNHQTHVISTKGLTIFWQKVYLLPEIIRSNLGTSYSLNQ